MTHQVVDSLLDVDIDIDIDIDGDMIKTMRSMGLDSETLAFASTIKSIVFGRVLAFKKPMM
jgi:hypothetical protein